MTDKQLSLLTSTLIFLYSASILVAGKSYSYVAMILCIISLLLLPITLKKKLPTDFYKIGLSLICYFFVTAISITLLGGELSNLDMPSRTLFILPVFILLLHYPPKREWVFIGILLGSMISGIIALYHYQILHIRAFSDFKYMVIQSGDIAMSLGIFSLIIAIQYLKEKKNKLVLIAIACASAGFLASLLSGARGGWLVAPFVIIWLLIINRQLISNKIILGLTVILIVSATISHSIVDKRVQQIVSDITQLVDQKNSDTSVGARLEMWKSGIYNFIENPVFGIGYQDRLAHNQRLVERKLVDPVVLKFSRLHNSYIEELSIKGIIGFIALLIFFCVPLYLFSTKKNLTDNVFVQLGISHVILVMGYCLTQNYINHHSGILQYLMYTIIFYSLLLQQVHTQLKDNKTEN